MTSHSTRPPLGPSPLEGGFEKVLVIRINHSYAGFFAYVTFAINQLLYAERMGYFPVVYFGPDSTDGPNAFHDPARGDNTWDYYFEPVAGLTYDDIRAMVADPEHPLDPDDLVFLTPEEAWYLHLEEPSSVYNYPYGYYQHKADFDREWYEVQRDRAHEVIERYVRVKPELLGEVDAFVEEHYRRPVLGIHLRGTDKGTAGATPHLMRVIPPSAYFEHVDRYTEEHGECPIFVATDQVQFLEQMRTRYGDRVLALDAIRTKGAFNTFQTPDEKNYVKGREVLLDCLLLSRTDHLLKCTSAVGEYATYFNRDLSDLDVNHIGKRTTVLDPVKVSFARARQLFRAHWRNLRALRGASPKEYVRLLVGFNPLTIFVWGTIETKRYSPSIFWRTLVSAKDTLWALSMRARLPLRYARQRSKVRKLRRGARHFDAADARFNRYLEVRSDASLGTGFFTQFLIVLNQLHFARAHRLEPVVNLDHAYHPHFDPARGGNVWENYFEPVTDTSLEDLRAVDPGSICLLDPSRQLSLTLGDSPAEPADPEEAEAWLRRLRLRGADLVERFVRVRPEVMSRVSDFERGWGSATVLGTHLRGTDRGVDWRGRRASESDRGWQILEPPVYLPWVDLPRGASRCAPLRRHGPAAVSRPPGVPLRRPRLVHRRRSFDRPPQPGRHVAREPIRARAAGSAGLSAAVAVLHAPALCFERGRDRLVPRPLPAGRRSQPGARRSPGRFRRGARATIARWRPLGHRGSASVRRAFSRGDERRGAEPCAWI